MVYPPVTGMLLTRYAPLRRSPAMYCYIPLPLDLHVLSLPLAFILSQDQTLHCIYLLNCLLLLYCSNYLFNKGIYALIINVNIYYTACLFNIFNELFPFYYLRVDRPSVLGPQRYGLFRNLQIFSQLFLKKFFVSKFRRTCPLASLICGLQR